MNISISAVLGDNVKDKVSISWYDGESLLNHLDNIRLKNRKNDASLRIPIMDVYNERGTMISGKVEQGIIHVGQDITVMPTGVVVSVKQLYINNEEVDHAQAGENISIRLDVDNVCKGFVICDMNKPKVVNRFVAHICLMDTLEHKPLITAGYKCMLHVHTIEQECTITKLLRPVDPKTGKPIRKPIVFIKKGQSALCLIKVEQSITIEEFSTMQQMGRLVLRDEGKTIVIGKVIQLE